MNNRSLGADGTSAQRNQNNARHLAPKQNRRRFVLHSSGCRIARVRAESQASQRSATLQLNCKQDLKLKAIMSAASDDFAAGSFIGFTFKCSSWAHLLVG